jgi:hypothetical protein
MRLNLRESSFFRKLDERISSLSTPGVIALLVFFSVFLIWLLELFYRPEDTPTLRSPVAWLRYYGSLAAILNIIVQSIAAFLSLIRFRHKFKGQPSGPHYIEYLSTNKDKPPAITPSVFRFLDLHGLTLSYLFSFLFLGGFYLTLSNGQSSTGTRLIGLTFFVAVSVLIWNYRRAFRNEQERSRHAMALMGALRIDVQRTLPRGERDLLIKKVLQRIIGGAEIGLRKDFFQVIRFVVSSLMGRRLGSTSAWVFIPKDGKFTVGYMETGLRGQGAYDLCLADYHPSQIELPAWDDTLRELASLEGKDSDKEVKKKELERKLRDSGSDIGYLFFTGFHELASSIYDNCIAHDRTYLDHLEGDAIVRWLNTLRSAVIVPVYSPSDGDGGNNRIAMLGVYNPSKWYFSKSDLQFVAWSANILGQVI